MCSLFLDSFCTFCGSFHIIDGKYLSSNNLEISIDAHKISVHVNKRGQEREKLRIQYSLLAILVCIGINYCIKLFKSVL